MTEANHDTAVFIATLKKHKKAIDADIAQYVEYLKSSSQEQYGDVSQAALDAYCEILLRGGKRLRGALVMEGYAMSGGTNQAMILQAARAMEMIHAQILIIDDIQDRSAVRRGGPAAHVALREFTKDEHTAETLATNAALLGCHAAMTMLANLDAPAQLRTNLMSILNRTLVVTAHGQIADALQTTQTTEADITNVQEWKTATYTVLNPLHMGMVLAGADCHVTDGVTPYAMAAGQAFQITDDIIGVFGDNAKSGKDNLDDFREGKQTLLTVYALEHANSEDRELLKKCLGNDKLTNKDFARCQEIIRQTGALEYAQKQADNYVAQALASLHENSHNWSAEGTEFLAGMATFLLTRTN